MWMTALNFPWEENSPEPLIDLCARQVVCHPYTFCVYFEPTGWKLKSDVALPSEICEKLISIWQDLDPSRLDDNFIEIFEDLSVTRLKRANLKGSNVSDWSIEVLLKHELVELDITSCDKLNKQTVEYINQRGAKLLSLILGQSQNIFPVLESSSMKDGSCPIVKQGYILNTPNLRRLVVRDLYYPMEPHFFALLLKPLHKLTHLDLSGCCFLNEMYYMQHLNYLVYLNLHAVQRIQDAINVILGLKTLRFLDISQSNSRYGMFENPKSVLSSIVSNLPNLSGLDISGTNLAQSETFETEDLDIIEPEDKESKNEYELLCDIPGLQGRVKNPLEFLGLYNTNACRRNNIPAKIVSIYFVVNF